MQTVRAACVLCGRQTLTEPFARGSDFEYGTTSEQFEFVRCRECKLVYLDPRPAPSELPVIYPPEYEPFHFGESRNPFVRHGRTAVQRAKVQTIDRLVGPSASILDVGCGSGELLRLLRVHGRPGWLLAGNDFLYELLEPLEREGFVVLPGRFEEIRPAERFDLIVLNQTIEHLENPAAVVARAHELLRPGGKLFIETPSLEGLDARLFRRRHWGGYHFPRHWTLFTEKTLRALVEQRGFRTLSVTPLPSPAFWTQSLHHVLHERRGVRALAGFWTIRNPLPLALFTAVDLARVRLGRATSNMRLVAERVEPQST